MDIGGNGMISVNVMEVHIQEVDLAMIDLPNQMDKSVLKQIYVQQQLLPLPLLPALLLLQAKVKTTYLFLTLMNLYKFQCFI